MNRRRVSLLLCGFASFLLHTGATAQTPTLIPSSQIDRAITEHNAFFLDVRTPDEIRELGTLPGYVNIPIDELPRRLAEVPRDRVILTA